MLSLTELIDQYLMGELTGQALIDFETRLKTDSEFSKEVDLQKMILKGIELASVSKQINTAQKNYWLKSILIKVVIGLLLAAGIGTLSFLATKKNQDVTPTEVIQKEQQFMINVNQDTLLETKNGMVFIIPANAFETESDSVEIKIEEALDAASIMMKGLTTVSDSLLLETAGMFKFDANVKGNKVNIIKEITASLPTDKVDKDMMLFSGKEDSKGNINWVNPQKLQQELVTYDIEKLNFFPKGYLEIIDTLYNIQGINEDSKRLYFEMSGYKNALTLATQLPAFKASSINNTAVLKQPVAPLFTFSVNNSTSKIGDIIEVFFKTEIPSGYHLYSTYNNCDIGPLKLKLFFDANQSYSLVGKPYSIGDKYHTDNTFKCEVGEFRGTAEVRQKIKLLSNNINVSGKIEGQICSDGRDNTCYEVANTFTGSFEANGSNISPLSIQSTQHEIDPSRIKAIWNKKFNKTILATKEFEERLQFIFTTCKADYINQYVNNMDKPLFYIDSLCAEMTSGIQREKFLEFYSRKNGGININDKALNKLHQYYEQKYEVYKTAAEKTWKDYYDKNKKEDQRYADKSVKRSLDESFSNSTIFNEELCKNLTNAYAQIGKTRDCNNSTPPKAQAYTFPISNTGWYNLDKYVFDATIQRKTLDYTDPVSGKRAVIIYSKCSIDIKNVDGFDFVNVYLLPNELSSYQKMRKVGNIFTESLNMSFNNKIVIVAKKGKDWYWNTIFKAEGKTYSIELKPINEFKLKKALNSFNESKKADILNDISYNEYVEEYQQALTKRKLLAEQKRRIAKVIFPCSIQDNSIPANPAPGTPDL